MDELEDMELNRILSSFSCEQDEDIEVFLRERAVKFEQLSKSCTYLAFDQDQLQKGYESLAVYGYISVALKVLSVPDYTSNRVRKELDGLSAKIHGTRIDDFPCYLIGQLARSSSVPKDSITGKQLVDFAFDVISAAVNAVGGRYVMIECHDDEKLVGFYRQNGFFEIARIPDKDKPMVQMVCKIIQ
ncbi:MAG: hypothetical protein LUH20_11130 [Lachnospiraceae bacterium]|nr:hypothetical protein [Lachnospiraceae bacterium]